MARNEDDVAALAALQAQGPGRLSAMAPQRRMSHICPHCQQGFSAASLPIHMRRCRALLPDPEAEAAAAAKATEKPAKPPKKRHVPTLVDLCLKFITRNFQGVCMDKVVAAPEHEAALIESLPPELVHRIIVNLVYENKQVAVKADKQRSKVRELQQALDEQTHQRGQLEGFRHQATMFRSRLGEQDQLLDRLRRDLEIVNQEFNAAKQENQQLRTQFSGFEKLQHRLEARINALSAENDKLKADVRNAQKKEMDAFKRLASAAKGPQTRTASRTEPRAQPQAAPKRPRQQSTSLATRRVQPRPETSASTTKIPLPASLSEAYLAKCVISDT
ncbi:hypothetical protein Poli38472_008201 [Pythium oligandrum]|uniref:Uncharacterized protein n=1 Tax=Pythium oligandrum TaxID=41045 RepID=A0A8K1CL70_PYTOL|nr:hypothetical protein Poli38472_008201 [Pythium oligandrum]|eukprot:TMW65559.1 hypothetical protein Poli38472_008201 [Pythium oligandrum]